MRPAQGWHHQTAHDAYTAKPSPTCVLPLGTPSAQSARVGPLLAASQRGARLGRVQAVRISVGHAEVIVDIKLQGQPEALN